MAVDKKHKLSLDQWFHCSEISFIEEDLTADSWSAFIKNKKMTGKQQTNNK